jgi:hypothetical protein
VAIDPPSEIVDILKVMGFHWPNINEDVFHDLADTFGEVGGEISAQTDKSNQAIHTLRSDIRADAYDILTSRWDGGAHRRLNDVANTFNDLHYACLAIYDAVTSVKLEIIARASVMAAEFAASQVAAAGGAVAGVLPGLAIEAAEQAVIYAAKEVLNAIFQRIEHHIFEELIQGKLGGLKADLDGYLESLVGDALSEVVNA